MSNEIDAQLQELVDMCISLEPEVAAQKIHAYAQERVEAHEAAIVEALEEIKIIFGKALKEAKNERDRTVNYAKESALIYVLAQLRKGRANDRV